MPSLPISLCESCQWCRIVQTPRGSRFLRCAQADVDRRFLKYPYQPILNCAGYSPTACGPSEPVADE